MSLINIAIIGGGACGISAFIELFLQFRIAGLHKKVSITIIEQNKEVGRGLAFGTRQPGHILNTQADLMGIHYTEPQHFSEWLVEHENIVEKEVVDNQGRDEAFTTRRLYGDYLQSQFDHYFELAGKEGMEVDIIHAGALKVSKTKSGFNVHLSGKRKHACHYLILAPGTPVANNYPELEKRRNYFPSPWPSAPIIEKIPKNADLGVLGSSLSAIDALMTLADNGHEGKITFYSFDGLLPRVQPENPAPYQCKFVTLKNLHQIQRSKLRNPFVKELFRLFMQEAEDYAAKKIDWKKVDRIGKPADKLLKEDIKIARDGGDALINIPYSLRYESSEIWKSLDEDERIKFKKWLGGYWGINRHCMPLVNAERIDKLFDDKQLSIVPNLKDVTFDPKKGFLLTYGEDEVASEKYLINATGPASALKMMKSELMAALAKSGLIEPEPVGGIRINTQTMQIVRNGKPYSNFYALGHITNGLLLDVNAVWFNVKTIGNLCQHLTSQIIEKAS